LKKYLKNVFGLRPKNIFLYEQAFTHRSADIIIRGRKYCNERLEFLGDAVIGLIVADYLYRIYPSEDEGFLTSLRSKIVCRQNLGKLAYKIDLESQAIIPDNYKHSKHFGGDLFEALFGAIYVDRGYKYAHNILVNKVLKLYVDVDELMKTETSYKSRLIEECQKNKTEIEFKLIKEESVNGRMEHWVEIFIDSQPTGVTACGNSIKFAEQLAAETYFITKIQEIDDCK
jgi:ribonuclease-3